MENHLESWIEIPAFKKYEVTDSGKIRNTNTKRELSLTPDPSGYVVMSLFDNDNVRISSVRLHILIAIVFIPNPDGKKTVNHKNKIRNDNNISNLEWFTSAEQNKHSADGGKKSRSGRSVWQCHPITRERIKLFKTVREASVHLTDKVSGHSKISLVATGAMDSQGKCRKSAYGFWWQYADKLIENQPGEVWVPIQCIQNNDSLYQISSHGRVIGVHGQVHPHRTDDSGYRVCSLNGHVYKLHVLVAQTFLRNPNGLPCVNHIDGNKANAHVDNLEWTTFSENSIHAGENGLTKHAIRRVEAYDRLTGEQIGKWRTLIAAEKETGVHNSAISSACRGKDGRHCAKKIYWKYADEEKAILGVKAYRGLEIVGQWLNVKGAARDIGCTVGGVDSVCNGRRQSIKGLVTKRENVNLGSAIGFF